MDSSSLSHTRYKCQYHIVFIPKYRKRIMYGRLKADVREIIKKLCDYRNIEIVEGAVCADHVHLCLSIPPSEKVSDVVGYIKGKSALMIHDKYPESVNGWSKAFWARGYYVATVGNITEDAVKRAKLVEKYAAKRAKLKEEGDYIGLSLLPKNSSRVRLHNRCKLTGRPRGYMRQFGISRIQFREMASAGLIPGVKKASW